MRCCPQQPPCSRCDSNEVWLAGPACRRALFRAFAKGAPWGGGKFGRKFGPIWTFWLCRLNLLGFCPVIVVTLASNGGSMQQLRRSHMGDRRLAPPPWRSAMQGLRRLRQGARVALADERAGLGPRSSRVCLRDPRDRRPQAWPEALCLLARVQAPPGCRAATRAAGRRPSLVARAGMRGLRRLASWSALGCALLLDSMPGSGPPLRGLVGS